MKGRGRSAETDPFRQPRRCAGRPFRKYKRTRIRMVSTAVRVLPDLLRFFGTRTRRTRLPWATMSQISLRCGMPREPVTHRPGADEPLRAVPGAQTLHVAATYTLSEAGRKVSLLAGGDGKAVQRLTLLVPAARLHLVSVDLNGVARLKLQPRFERVDGQDVVRRDGPPTYDVPPSVEDLFKEAARNTSSSGSINPTARGTATAVATRIETGG